MLTEEPLILCGLPADLRRYSRELSSLVKDIRDFGCKDKRAAKHPGNPSPTHGKDKKKSNIIAVLKIEIMIYNLRETINSNLQQYLYIN